MRSATAPEPEEISVVTVRLPREQIELLRAIAKAEYRSISAEIRKLIEERIADADLPEAA